MADLTEFHFKNINKLLRIASDVFASFYEDQIGLPKKEKLYLRKIYTLYSKYVKKERIEKKKSIKRTNGYVLFEKHYRDTLLSENPKISNLEVSKELGRIWKEEIDDTEKQMFKEKAAQLNIKNKKN